MAKIKALLLVTWSLTVLIYGVLLAANQSLVSLSFVKVNYMWTRIGSVVFLIFWAAILIFVLIKIITSRPGRF